MFFEVSPRYWEVIIESRTSSTGMCIEWDIARAREVFPVPGGTDKEEFSYLVDPVFAQEVAVVERMVYLIDDRGLFGRTDKVFHLLFDLFRCGDNDQVERAPYLLVFADDLCYLLFEACPGVLERRVCFADILIRYFGAIERFKEESECRVDPDKGPAALCEEPFRRGFQGRNLEALAEVLVRTNGFFAIFSWASAIPRTRLIRPSLT